MSYKLAPAGAIHYLFDENENYVGTKEDITRNKIFNNKYIK